MNTTVHIIEGSNKCLVEEMNLLVNKSDLTLEQLVQSSKDIEKNLNDAVFILEEMNLLIKKMSISVDEFDSSHKELELVSDELDLQLERLKS